MRTGNVNHHQHGNHAGISDSVCAYFPVIADERSDENSKCGENKDQVNKCAELSGLMNKIHHHGIKNCNDQKRHNAVFAVFEE